MTNLNPPSTPIETIDIGNYDEIPVEEILKNMIFIGLASNINDPSRISLTMDAFQDHAVLTVPVLRGAPGDPGDDAMVMRFEAIPITDLDQLPTDLGDFLGDLGKFYVHPVVDRVTGNPIATTLYVWTGVENGSLSMHPGLGKGWVQLPVGTPGPPGVYPDIDPSIVVQPQGSGHGPFGADSWVKHLGGPPSNPQLQFNLAVPEGEDGPSSPLGGFIDIDFQTTPPKANDVVVCSNRTTPSAPTGLARVGSSSGGTLPAATYYYVVTAVVPNGETVASNEVSITTTGSTSSVALTWSAPSGSGSTGYRVYRGLAAGQEKYLVAAISSGTQTSFTDIGNPVADGSPPATGIPSGEPIWVNEPQLAAAPKIYTMPESAFTSGLSISFFGGEKTVGVFALPQQPWPWVPFVFGSIVVDGLNLSLTPLQAAARVRLGDNMTGQIVASGAGSSIGTVTVSPDLGTATVTPVTGTAVVPANHTGSLGTLFFNLVEFGLIDIFEYNAGKNAQLSVLVVPLVTGVTAIGSNVPLQVASMGTPTISSSVNVVAQAFPITVQMPTPTVTVV